MTCKFSRSTDEEFYFSNNFLVNLKLYETGLVDGWVIHYPIGLNLAKRFSGVFVEEKQIINVSFFITWTNPNIDNEVLTAYSGKISREEGKRNQLLLEWTQLNESKLQIGSFIHGGTELLYDRNDGDSGLKGSSPDPFKVLHLVDKLRRSNF